ncbi:MAG: sulfotransferase domain-containing protein [Planctomycetota bacterium]|nr:sulfotransferase domain-containing protein [Planctomycetota bacterium]
MMRLFLSYPKAGRTWVRFMLNSYLCRRRGLEPVNVFRIEEATDGSYPFQWTHLTAAMLMKLPYWSMGCFDRRPLAGASCVLLVRDFYATLASAWHQAVHRIRVFQGTPGEFLRSPRYGVIKLVTFYNLWTELAPSLGRREIISYDAMLDDPVDPLRRILAAFDIPGDDALVEDVVAEASFENMKRLGATPAYAGTVLAPADPNNPDSAKVRVGGKSKYDQLFSEADLAYIDRVVDDLLVERNAPHFAACRERRSAVGVSR